MKTHRPVTAAFSLLELLIVIAIIAILASVGVVSLGVAGGKGAQSASVVASSVFNLARTEAIMRGTDTLVVVDVTPTSANYLRRMSVATNGTLIANWTTLPSTAFFNTNLSTPAGTTNLSTVTGTFAFYKFKANGQSDNPAAKFVVSQGAVVNNAFQETGTNRRYGFVIHKMGKLTFIDDPALIQ